MKEPKKPDEPTTEARVDWLLRFLQRDVDALRAGELLDAGADAARYLLDLRAVITDDAEGVAFLREGIPEWLPDSRKGLEHLAHADVFTVTRPELQSLQTALREGMRALDERRSWLPFAPLQMVVERRADGTIGRRSLGAIAPMLLASAVDLLTQAQIRRCKHEPCGILFRPKENRQLYHDFKCSSLARYYRLPAKPKRKRDHKQELANAARREALKKTKTAKGRTR